jgi:hypothetical protein
MVRVSRNVPEAPAPIRLTANEYESFIGQYRKTLLFGLLQVGPTLSISHPTDELGDHLVAAVQGVPGYDIAELFPASKTSFRVNPITTDDDIRLTFVPNKKGETTCAKVYWNGRKLKGSRISVEPFR